MLTIVFISYNCGEDIAGVIEQIKDGDYPLAQLRIIVVDNASSDNSISVLESISGVDLTIVESTENLGFGAGCNLAFNLIPNEGRVLLLNPDVKIRHDSISNLVAYADSYPEALIWGGLTVDEYGNRDGKNVWKEPTLRGILSWALFGDVLLKKMGKAIPDAYSDFELQNSEQVDAVSGCFLLIDTNLVKRLDGFDDQFFMYSEEIDLCRRARELGARPRFTRDAVIVHEGSKTVSSLNKLKFLYRSKLLYSKKYWKHWRFLVARVAVYLGSFLRASSFKVVGFFLPKYMRQAAVWSEFFREQSGWRFR